VHELPALLAGDPTGDAAPTLMEQAYRQLRREIIELRREPGSVFTEADVAAAGGWSKTPVREALARLHRDGLVTPRRRAGYVVAPVTLRDASELCDLRILLQAESAALTAQRGLGPDELERLRELCADDEDGQLGGPRFDERLRRNYEFEWTIARHSGNERLTRMVVSLLDEIERVVRLAIRLEPSMPAARMSERRDVVEAIAVGDATRARSAMRRRTVSARSEILGPLASSAALAEVAITVPAG
jgi:GntR family transcriptional regulator, rspAB operon transcriptional repressor